MNKMMAKILGQREGAYGGPLGGDESTVAANYGQRILSQMVPVLATFRLHGFNDDAVIYFLMMREVATTRPASGVVSLPRLRPRTRGRDSLAFRKICGPTVQDLVREGVTHWHIRWPEVFALWGHWGMRSICSSLAKAYPDDKDILEGEEEVLRTGSTG